MAPVTKEPKTENDGGAAVAKPKSNGISKPKKGTSAKKDGEEKDERPSSTIKIQHIPYGFFEDQLKGYFDQFGSIRSVRVPRNEKTGKDQNYAFVTFTDDDVAAIAAETMNGYLLAQKRLLVKVLKRWEVPDFCRTGAPILARPHAGAKVRKLAEKANEEKTDEQKENAENRMVERLRKKNEALKELGVDYEVPVPAKAQRKRKSDSPAVKKAEQEVEGETEDVEEEPEPSPKKKKVTKAKATVAEKPKKAQKGKKDVEKPVTPVKEDEGATTDDEPVLPVAKTAKAAKGANKKANIEEVAEKPKQTKTAKAKVAAAEKEVGSDAAPVKRSTRTNKKMVEEAIAEFEKEEEALAKLEVEVAEPVKKGKATKVSKKAKNPAPVEQEEEVAPAATEPITKKGGKATKKTAEVVEEVVQQKKAPKIAERKKKAAPTEETEDEPEPEPVVKKSKAAAKKTEVAEKKVAVAETKPKTGAKKTRK